MTEDLSLFKGRASHISEKDQFRLLVSMISSFHSPHVHAHCNTAPAGYPPLSGCGLIPCPNKLVTEHNPGGGHRQQETCLTYGLKPRHSSDTGIEATEGLHSVPSEKMYWNAKLASTLLAKWWQFLQHTTGTSESMYFCFYCIILTFRTYVYVVTCVT